MQIQLNSDTTVGIVSIINALGTTSALIITTFFTARRAGRQPNEAVKEEALAGQAHAQGELAGRDFEAAKQTRPIDPETSLPIERRK